MDPFPRRAPGGDALIEKCRRRGIRQNSTTGAGGPRIPLYKAAGCLHTRSCLTPRQQHQLAIVSSENVALEATWASIKVSLTTLPLR